MTMAEAAVRSPDAAGLPPAAAPASSGTGSRIVAHLRLRKFNTRDAYPDQKLDNDLCMAVRAGNTVYLRGQTAMDLDGRIVGIGDPAAQAENAMKCVKILLEEAGAKLEHITKITIYITDRAYREPVYRVVGKWLKGVYPVSTGLIVQGLARIEYLMEIDVIAEIPSA
jgi:enamine deaminase RidA (YjgF/YER057c/UK114 family)